MLKPYHSINTLECGLDEAGVGCLAGPLFAGAVIWPPNLAETLEDNDDALAALYLLNDSKKLTPHRRNLLFGFVKDYAIDWAVGIFFLL